MSRVSHIPNFGINNRLLIRFVVQRKHEESVPFAHIAIDHSHSQQPVPRGFPLFKRCEWLMRIATWANRRYSNMSIPESDLKQILQGPTIKFKICFDLAMRPSPNKSSNNAKKMLQPCIEPLKMHWSVSPSRKLNRWRKSANLWFQHFTCLRLFSAFCNLYTVTSLSTSFTI